MMMVSQTVRSLMIYSGLVLLVPMLSLAASSDTVTVSQAINTLDPIPPTIPANFTAVPVATTQIDLAWDAASDNIGVDGYQVFRNGTHIATTTQIQFSDTGLIASTTYTYFVTAFDANVNFSTSTPTVATTTLSEPVIGPPTKATSTGSSYGYVDEPLLLEAVELTTTLDSVSIIFSTNGVSRADVRWGRTAAYELGYTSSDILRTEHTTIIDNLEAGTRYELEIRVVNEWGDVVIEERSFQTQAGADSVAPPNVIHFSATSEGEVVRLDWRNPDVDDFDRVRVLSSDHFFPEHPFGGWLVYDGVGQDVIDSRPIPSGTTRYYAIFVYDKVGNISSGAVTYLALRGGDGELSPHPFAPEVEITGESSAPSTDRAPFSFFNISFFQAEIATSSYRRVILDASQEMLISLPYELVPERLKSIVVTFYDPDIPERQFSFLLKVNADQTAYQARLAAFNQGGVFPVTVSLFDYKTQAISSVHGEVALVLESDSSVNESSILIGSVRNFLVTIFALVGISLCLWRLILIIFRRRKEVRIKTFKKT